MKSRNNSSENSLRKKSKLLIDVFKQKSRFACRQSAYTYVKGFTTQKLKSIGAHRRRAMIIP